MLKSKIHRAVVTGTELDYEGSITIDENLLEKAHMLPNEQVHVLNCNNGARFITYAIAAPRDSGSVILNGPAARLAVPGDRVIIMSYSGVEDNDCYEMMPKVVIVDRQNRAVDTKGRRGDENAK
jgi:aspartate 1-decarboxylase